MPTTPLSGPDYCSRQGALALKERIEAFWRERGQIVNATILERGFHPALRTTRYELRSNLVNGLPCAQTADTQEV